MEDNLIDIKSKLIERAVVTSRAVSEYDDVFVISDESVDGHQTVFRLDGWELDKYKDNNIVTYGHPDVNDTDDTVIIGRSDVWVEGNKLVAGVIYDKNNDRAVRIQNKVKDGFLNMTSIRAYVEDARWSDEKRGEPKDVLVYTKQRLVDFGIVMHGSNGNAKVKRESIIERYCPIDQPAEKIEPVVRMDYSTELALANSIKERINKNRK